MVRRQQAFGQWTGNLVIATLNRQVILDLPDLPITSRSIKSIGLHPAGLLKILTARHPDVCAMLYEDQHSAPWCIRLSGPGLPVLQVDMFKSHARIAVLV
jgi:hypothetical protein